MALIHQAKDAIKTPGFKPKQRTYARYNEPAGYGCEEKDFEMFEKAGKLKRGELYVVEKVDKGSSHTDIYLEGFDLPLNSVAFDFFTMEKGQLVDYDIYGDRDLDSFMF